MTQAFNLSQLANNLNTAGQLDATDGLVNAVPVANGGTGATTAAAARTNLGVAEAVFSVPSGGIIIWSGAQAAIPSGWFLCNGANGTPDLRDRFIVGAGTSYAVGASGGSKDAIVVSHTHTASTNTASLTGTLNNFEEPFGSASGIVSLGNSGQAYYGGTGTTANRTATINASHSHTVTVNSAGSSGTNANLPPYYALCYIMKS